MPKPELPHPTPEQLAALTPAERRAFRLSDFFLRHLRWWTDLWNLTFMNFLTWLATSRRLHVVGLEHVAEVTAARAVILVANHRSFFDFFQVMAVTFNQTRFGKRVLFPVRGDFFYDHFLGPPVNFLMSGMAMFPPVLRRRRSLPFNAYGLERLVAELAIPGTLVGIHPEGTRNKTDDPYTLLRASRGVGMVALKAPAEVSVVPLFVLGADNSLPGEILRNLFRPDEYPLYVYFGPPVELDDLRARADEPRAWKEAARRCVQAIEALGEQQRADVHGPVAAEAEEP